MLDIKERSRLKNSGTMKWRISVSLLAALAVLALAPTVAKAACPVCVGVAAGGTLLARWLGVADLAIGVWQGAFVAAFALWLAGFLGEKIKALDRRKEALEVSSCLLVFLGFVSAFYLTGLMEGAEYVFWYVDKLTLGMLVGITLIPIGMSVSERVKGANGGTAVIPFQSTIIVLVLALTTSGVLQVIS